MSHRFHYLCIILLVPALLSGCARPYIYPVATVKAAALLNENYAVMDDGYRLPVRHWGSLVDTQAIVLAIHGLNDYGNGFESTGSYLARKGITLISYDQRGFGETIGHGYWHGSQRMIDDSRTMLRLLREQFSDKALFLLGESMGGAIVLTTLSHTETDISGSILIAPAIWSRQTMPWYQRLLLWLAAHTVPAKQLTGEGLDLMPSDNIEMLRALGKDPLVIKETRVDVLYGVTNLMDVAASTSPDFTQTSLILYGKHDQIVPRKPTCAWLNGLPEQGLKDRKIIIYENGYHMLNRDLQAEQVLDDIAIWIHTILRDGNVDDQNSAHVLTARYDQGKKVNTTLSTSDFCQGRRQ